MCFQYIKEQKGSAALLAMLAMLILGTSVGVYLTSTGAGIKNGDALVAQYAAEAGVIYALANAKQHTPSETGIWDVTKLSTATVSLGDSTTNSAPTFTVTATLKENPTGFKGTYYKITATGKAGSTTRSIDAYLTVPAISPPQPITTFNLMNDADYSGSKWKMHNIDSDNPYASAPADAYYQVLFKDTVYANDENHKDAAGNKGFTLNYNVNLVSTNPGHPNDAGYGIYYLATGSATNMTAYVLQYDPGLSPDQILVKKVIANTKSTTQPWLNEVFGGGTQSFQGSTWKTPQWDSPVTHPAVTNPDGTTTPATTTTSLNNINPSTTSTQDLMTIPMTTVLQQLDALKINGGKNKMTGQNHQLTIDARPDANGRVVHTISMDGLQILKFIDRGNNGPILTSGSTGLRVWEANANFFNNTNGFKSGGAIDSIKIRSWGTEK